MTHAGEKGEEGSIAVETVIGLFSLLIVLCAVVEFASWTVVQAAVDDASYAACRALAQDTSLTSQQLSEIALQASPSLRGALTVSERRVAPVVTEEYVHHLPNAAGDRASHAAGRKVAVEITCTYPPLTLVGRLVTGGGDKTFSASTVETADATIEEGVSPW